MSALKEMDSEWNTETYRTVPQMELAEKVETKEYESPHDVAKQKSPQGNMFVQSMFDMTLITVNFCQICYVLKVGPGLGWLYYLLLGLFGTSLGLLFLHGIMGLFGRLRCSKPLPGGCFNCLYNASMFMVVLVYLVNVVGSVLMLKEAENKCQLMLTSAKTFLNAPETILLTSSAAEMTTLKLPED